MNNLAILTKYILIAVLAVGIFVLWSENQTLKQSILNQRDELGILKLNNEKLQKTIIEKDNLLKEKILFQNTKINSKLKLELNTKIQELKLQNNTALQKQKDENKPKHILLILPEDEKKYTKVIPKIDFKDIELSIQDINKNKQLKQIQDDFKINPEIFIDKDTKKLDGAKISIEKKF